MCHVALVQVRQRIKQLFDDPLGLLLRESPLWRRFQMRMQRLSLSVLHHQVYVLWRVYGLVELNYIAVVKLA